MPEVICDDNLCIYNNFDRNECGVCPVVTLTKEKIWECTLRKHVPIDPLTEWMSDIQDKINLWVEELKGQIQHGASTTCSTCETGDPVVTLALMADGGHVKPEGAYAPALDNPDIAWNAFVFGFESYRIGKKGKLYWRTTPVIIHDPETGKYRIYARCFIADK